MAEKKLMFTCAYCGKETTIIVNIARPLATKGQLVARSYDCAHCNKPNKVSIPDNLDVHVFILGGDEGFLGYTDDGVPRLQGEQEL
jgi:transcription elongation factor Elf1